MKHFLVRFTGHVNERTRPEYFPKKIIVDYTEELSDENLKLFVQSKLGDFIHQQGMVVAKDQNKMIDDSKLTFDKKMFVPMHMIAWIDVQIGLLSQAPAQEIIDGRAQLGGGDSAPIQ